MGGGCQSDARLHNRTPTVLSGIEVGIDQVYIGAVSDERSDVGGKRVGFSQYQFLTWDFELRM